MFLELHLLPLLCFYVITLQLLDEVVEFLVFGLSGFGELIEPGLLKLYFISIVLLNGLPLLPVFNFKFE